MGRERETPGTVVQELLGGRGDSAVVDYIKNVLEDGEFDYGDEGQDAYDAFGEMLVGADCVDSEEDAHDVCLQLALRLGDPSAKRTEAFRSLKGGPLNMDEATSHVALHPSEVFSGRAAIQTPYAEYNVGADLPQMTERERLKMAKRVDKDERNMRAAAEAAQARAHSAASGAAPTISRNQGGPGAHDLHLENFDISNGGAELIENATLVLALGRRYGLVGRNGTGKTTFLRALASKSIKGIPDNVQVLHVEQEVLGDATTALESLLACDTERTALLKEEAVLMSEAEQDDGASANGASANGGSANGGSVNGGSSNGHANGHTNGVPGGVARLQQVYKRLQEIDADNATARASSILAGLSFTPEMMAKSTRSFSGGWRMRIALARALFVEPDLLLLDEPTNHLDLHAVLWLQDYLTRLMFPEILDAWKPASHLDLHAVPWLQYHLYSWPKTLVVVSHARNFLNEVATDVVHLHSRKMMVYRGNFDTFEKTAAERLKNARKQAESQQQAKDHMQAFVDKFRYNAKRASLVQSRIKAIERMADIELVEADPEYCFRFPDPDPINPPVLGFSDVSFNYPDGPTLFHNLNFGIDMDSRLAMVGPNGIGKSTLLSLIGGTLEPCQGFINRNPRTRFATFSQHHVDGLDLALNPLQYMCRCFANTPEQELRSHLGSFGVGGDLALQAMYTLSGGQKSRVAFAKVTFTKPQILLLDEPSNHLDLDAVQALIQGLNLFKGGVLMVSHDQHLIEATVDELWAVEGGRAAPFHGTFEDYKKKFHPKK